MTTQLTGQPGLGKDGVHADFLQDSTEWHKNAG